MTVPEYLRQQAKVIKASNELFALARPEFGLEPNVEETILEIAERWEKMVIDMTWAHSVLAMAEDRGQISLGANMSKFAEGLAATRAPLGEKK